MSEDLDAFAREKFRHIDSQRIHTRVHPPGSGVLIPDSNRNLRDKIDPVMRRFLFREADSLAFTAAAQ
jgi:hypothetical protein